MSIDRVDFPNAAPIDITDWEDIIDVAEFNTLGTHNPVDWDFAGNTVKQGVQIMIGGSIYLSTTSTAVTGTPSDFVKITPSGSTAAAAYVSSLSGVTWNSVWNFYEDGSGNAYLFNEAKQVAEGVVSSPKTVVGAYAEHAYAIELTSTGQTILARDGDQVGIGNVTDFTSGVQQIILGPNENDVVTDAGDHGGALYLVDSVASAGSGGALYFGNSAGDDSAVGFAAIKGSLISGTTNTRGNLDFYTRANVSDIALTRAGRITENQNLLLGTTVDTGPRSVINKSGSSLPGIDSDVVQLLQNNALAGDDAYLSIISSTTGEAGIYAGDTGNAIRGQFLYDNNNDSWSVHSAGSLAMTVANDQNVTFEETILVDTIAQKSASTGVAVQCVTGESIKTKILSNISFAGSATASMSHGVTLANIRGISLTLEILSGTQRGIESWDTTSTQVVVTFTGVVTGGSVYAVLHYV